MINIIRDFARIWSKIFILLVFRSLVHVTRICLDWLCAKQLDNRISCKMWAVRFTKLLLFLALSWTKSLDFSIGQNVPTMCAGWVSTSPTLRWSLQVMEKTIGVCLLAPRSSAAKLVEVRPCLVFHAVVT